jgi:hypothetical protein
MICITSDQKNCGKCLRDGNRPQKITFAEMRSADVRGGAARTIAAAITLRSAPIPGLTMFGCPISSPSSFAPACGKRAADVRPDFHWGISLEA